MATEFDMLFNANKPFKPRCHRQNTKKYFKQRMRLLEFLARRPRHSFGPCFSSHIAPQALERDSNMFVGAKRSKNEVADPWKNFSRSYISHKSKKGRQSRQPCLIPLPEAQASERYLLQIVLCIDENNKKKTEATTKLSSSKTNPSPQKPTYVKILPLVLLG